MEVMAIGHTENTNLKKGDSCEIEIYRSITIVTDLTIYIVNACYHLSE